MPGFYDPALKDNNNIGEYPLNTVLPYQVGPGVTSLRSVIDDEDKPSQPADIVYRPIWPTTVPVLNRGDTLAMPKFGLPAIRGQSSAEVLYQQSIANAQQSSFDDMKIVVDSVSDSANQYYLQAINPEGSKYENGEGPKNQVRTVCPERSSGRKNTKQVELIKLWHKHLCEHPSSLPDLDLPLPRGWQVLRGGSNARHPVA